MLTAASACCASHSVLLLQIVGECLLLPVHVPASMILLLVTLTICILLVWCAEAECVPSLSWDKLITYLRAQLLIKASNNAGLD